MVWGVGYFGVVWGCFNGPCDILLKIIGYEIPIPNSLRKLPRSLNLVNATNKKDTVLHKIL